MRQSPPPTYRDAWLDNVPEQKRVVNGVTYLTAAAWLKLRYPFHFVSTDHLDEAATVLRLGQIAAQKAKGMGFRPLNPKMYHPDYPDGVHGWPATVWRPSWQALTSGHDIKYRSREEVHRDHDHLPLGGSPRPMVSIVHPLTASICSGTVDWGEAIQRWPGVSVPNASLVQCPHCHQTGLLPDDGFFVQVARPILAQTATITEDPDDKTLTVTWER